MPEKRDYGLDLLRIAAMFIVVSFHFFAVAGYGDTILVKYHGYHWGFVGTCIFFALSGYLFAARTDPAKFRVIEFYRKRAVSLYPYIITCFLAGYVVNSVLGGNWLYGGNPLKIFLSILGVDAYLDFYGIRTYFVTGEWFTAMILVIYILCPLLLYALHRFFAAGTVMVTALFLFESYYKIQPDVPVDASIFTALFVFWCGMAAGKYRGYLFKVETKAAMLCFSLSAVLAAVWFPSSGSCLFWRVMLGLGAFVILFYAFHIPGYPEASRKIIFFFSRISFTVYLVHHFVIVQVLSRYGLILVCSKKRMAATYILSWPFIILVSYLICILVTASIKLCRRLGK